MSRAVASTLLLVATVLVAGCGTPRKQVAPGLRGMSIQIPVPARDDTASLLLYLPPGYADGQLWPALLYLHGGSQRGRDLSKLRSYGPPRLLANGWMPPFFVIAPQLTEGEIWSDATSLIALLDELGRRYPIDPDRVYVTGMSMGGRGAWYLAYRHPERFAAIAPVAAFHPISHWAVSGRLRSVPVRAYHGNQDDLAPLADATALHESMQAVGGESELVVLEGRNHFISDVFEDPELYRWLLQHRRRGPPASERTRTRSVR